MTIPYIQATWTATSLGVLFGRYDIDRTEDFGITWDRVAEITSEPVNLYRDYEARRDFAIGYRIRVVRTDGAASAWSAADSETIASTGWLLLSNEAPELALEVDAERDTDQGHTWEFPTNEAEYLIAGRDGAVVLKGLEDPGDRFVLNLVAVDETAPTRAAFDAVLALSRAALAYVCVVSPEGHRWLANLTVDQGNQADIRQTYRTPVIVRELTAIPSVVDVAVPPA